MQDSSQRNFFSLSFFLSFTKIFRSCSRSCCWRMQCKRFKRPRAERTLTSPCGPGLPAPRRRSGHTQTGFLSAHDCQEQHFFFGFALFPARLSQRWHLLTELQPRQLHLKLALLLAGGRNASWSQDGKRRHFSVGLMKVLAASWITSDTSNNCV